MQNTKFFWIEKGKKDTGNSNYLANLFGKLDGVFRLFVNCFT